jgi:MFS family permease
MAASQNMSTLITFVSLYGFSSGICISVTPAVVRQITREEMFGAQFGAFWTTTAVVTLISPPVGGALIREEALLGYRPLVVFLVCFLSHSIQRRNQDANARIVVQGCTLLFGGGTIFIARFLHEHRLSNRF